MVPNIRKGDDYLFTFIYLFNTMAPHENGIEKFQQLYNTVPSKLCTPQMIQCYIIQVVNTIVREMQDIVFQKNTGSQPVNGIINIPDKNPITITNAKNKIQPNG